MAGARGGGNPHGPAGTREGKGTCSPLIRAGRLRVAPVAVHGGSDVCNLVHLVRRCSLGELAQRLEGTTSVSRSSGAPLAGARRLQRWQPTSPPFFKETLYSALARAHRVEQAIRPARHSLPL
jgi:hypothetical protein